MLTAESHIGSMGVGVTAPQLFRGDDGFFYVVKLQRNRLGVKVLANELLGSLLGRKLELCFPAGGIIELGERTLSRSPYLLRVGVAAGKQFACRYLPESYYLDRRKLVKAVNKKQMAGVMLFDHLLHNRDRTWNRKNLLIRREEEGARIYAIDNSHLFLKGRWTPESLRRLAGRLKVNQRRVYGELLKRYLCPADFEPYAQALRRLSNEEIEGMVGQIPEEWLPLREERLALIEHIMLRRDMVDDICRSIFALIPDIDRSTHDN